LGSHTTTGDRGVVTNRERSIWYDVGWPLLAGLVAAAGVLLAYFGIGLVGTVVAFALMELTVAPTAWSLMTEAGRSGRPAIFELAPACALAAVVTLGLVDGMGVWAFPLLASVAVTSPLLQEQQRRSWARGHGSDLAEMRHEFDEIVTHGFGSDRTET
jgi:hypothetical protein